MHLKKRNQRIGVEERYSSLSLSYYRYVAITHQADDIWQPAPRNADNKPKTHDVLEHKCEKLLLYDSSMIVNKKRTNSDERVLSVVCMTSMTYKNETRICYTRNSSSCNLNSRRAGQSYLQNKDILENSFALIYERRQSGLLKLHFEMKAHMSGIK